MSELVAMSSQEAKEAVQALRLMALLANPGHRRDQESISRLAGSVAPSLQKKLALTNNSRLLLQLPRTAPSAPRIFDQREEDIHKAIGNIKSPEYAALVKRTFDMAFSELEKSVEEHSGIRLQMAYRIVRELARIKGICEADETLATTIQADPSDHYGHDPYKHPSQTFLIDRCTGYPLEELRSFLEQLDNQDPQDYSWVQVSKKSLKPRGGLALCPPPMPIEFIEFSENDVPGISESYKTREDATLKLFMAQNRVVIHYLGLENGTKTNPENGFLGLNGLIDYDFVRQNWPSAAEIVSYEHLLLTELMRMMVEKSTKTTLDYMTNTLGFNALEIQGHMKMVRALARIHAERDQDEERAISLLRLEEYRLRAQESLDLKAEMNALKQIAMIMGLTRSEADDNMQDFMDVVKNVSAKAAKGATEAVLEDADITTMKNILQNQQE